MRALPLTLLLVCAGSAVADEKEVMVALQPAFALAHVGAETAFGGGAALDLSYGLSDALAVRATGAYTAHTVDKVGMAPAGDLRAWHAGLGLTYTIDILRVVPYIDFSVGVLGMTRPGPTGDVTTNQLGVELGVGVDYLLTRRWSVGVVARYHAFLQALSQIPIYFYAGPRIAFRFGG